MAEGAEAAARMAEAALKASQKERKAAEIMHRTAKETAEKFAEKASRDARPQLDMMARHWHMRMLLQTYDSLQAIVVA